MNKVVLLNGPPRSGKDTIAGYLSQKGFAHFKFANFIKKAIPELLPLNLIKGKDIEVYKDEIVMNDISVRKLLIDLSEEFIKPRFGKGYFGFLLAEYIKDFYGKAYIPNIVISDCGFQEEVYSFINNLPVDLNYLIVRLSRKDCNFRNDSRDFLYMDDIKTINISNDKSPLDLGIIEKILLEIEE